MGEPDSTGGSLVAAAPKQRRHRFGRKHGKNNQPPPPTEIDIDANNCDDCFIGLELDAVEQESPIAASSKAGRRGVGRNISNNKTANSGGGVVRRRFGKARSNNNNNTSSRETEGHNNDDLSNGPNYSDGSYKSPRTTARGGGFKFKNPLKLKKKKDSKHHAGAADSGDDGDDSDCCDNNHVETSPVASSMPIVSALRNRSYSQDSNLSVGFGGEQQDDAGYGSGDGCGTGGGGHHEGGGDRATMPPPRRGVGRGVSFEIAPSSATLSSCDSMLASYNNSNSASGGGTGGYTGRISTTTGSMEQQGQRARYSTHTTGRRGGKRQEKFRVRPYHAYTEPVYLTEEEIYNDSTKPSVSYEMLTSTLAPSVPMLTKNIQVPEETKRLFGSPEMDGRIGALRVEVLGCVSIARQKPDLGVYLVCGDSAFCTDVIQGYRSPMWPSKCKRAAVFPIHHVYTQVYAGVFDVKVRKNKENDVFCGRIAIDVASLRPDTEYDITFPLRASSFVYDRRKRGVLRMRFALHLFSERAAVISYFQKPCSPTLVEGCPTITCADPKTFRNVAVTVYGHDLPGKYSRNAFRATMREFNLYQQNIQVVIKHLILEAVMYDKPIISVYLFIAGMHCVLSSAVSHIPPYFIGYILILYIENYFHYVEKTGYNEGYQQLTIPEVFKALIFQGGERYFEPVLVKKKAKDRSNKRQKHAAHAQSTLRRMQEGAAGGSGGGSDNEYDANAAAAAEEKKDELMDHREFPFADREAYPNFGVEDALAPSSKAGANNTRLHGRLSVYYTPTPDSHAGATANADNAEDEDESSEDSGSDDQSVSGFGDDMFNMDDEMDDEDADVETLDHRMNSDRNSAYGYGDDEPTDPAILIRNAAKCIRRLRVGPPQDSDVKGRKIPPQVHLKKVEHMLHKITKSLSVELITPPAYAEDSAANGASASDDEAEDGGMTAPSNALIAKKRKLINDEFDKLLGLNAKSANPLNRILSSFLGPLMRIIRIVLFIMRIAFNAVTWRDPYLSFWILCALILVGMVLMVFPWRGFFFLSTLVCLGPQNIFVKRYLEKRTIEKERKRIEEAALARKEQMESSMDNTTAASGSGWLNSFSTTASSGDTTSNNLSAADKTRFFFQRTIGVVGQAGQVVGSVTSATAKATAKATVQVSKAAAQGAVAVSASAASQVRRPKRPSLDNNSTLQDSERPAFSANPSAAYNKGYKPRAVTVPYSVLQKSRFFDWPPDPTVSRATPLELQEMPRRALPQIELEQQLPQQQQHQQPQQQHHQHQQKTNQAPSSLRSTLPFQLPKPLPISDLLPGYYSTKSQEQQQQQRQQEQPEEPASSLRQRRSQKESAAPEGGGMVGVPLYI